MGRRVAPPKMVQVNRSLTELAKEASRLVQRDYKYTLKAPELRVLTAVYVQRLADLLVDESTPWKEEDKLLCLEIV